MIEKIKDKLLLFNYEIQENDDLILNLILEKTELYIKNYCNILSIPDELNCVLVDMAIANFLKEKKSISTQCLLGLDLTQAIQSIREGDTSITFAIGNGNETPEQKLNSLINYLIIESEKVLASYRCLKW